jgi:peptidyl-prolyl cis-trans isomerase SurA
MAKMYVSKTSLKTGFLTLFILFGLNFPSSAQNQDDAVLMQISDEKITVEDFMAVYKKNNVEGEVLDKKSVEEYLDLFINFKLKVKEAEARGLDTVRSFINELKGYRDQLAKPYFVDEEVNAQLLQEAYNRKQYDLRASHILIRADQYASPKDTLKAYNKIEELRKRIVEGGEDFNDVAEEASEDPSARDMPAQGFQPPRKGNRGDIGYFTVFDMVLPFEDAAYNLEVGEVSKPVRTEFGYHLVKLQNKKPALGKVQVAHLFLKTPENATSEQIDEIKVRIDSIHGALLNRADWDKMVKLFSDDKSSAENGGKLPWFGSNRMVPDFIDGIRELKQSGDFSKPVLTSYGWHIIRMVEAKPIGTFEEEVSELKQSLSKDKRSDLGKESIIRKTKQKAGFKENKTAIDEIFATVDSSIYKRKWDSENADGLTKMIFSLGDEVYTQKDFAAYLSKKQSISNRESIQQFLEKSYNNFVDEKVISYKDARLEEMYPEFKSLVKEYRDGILLFELTDQMVWSKAIKDTTGLKKFYENNRNNYSWDKRIDAALVSSQNRSDVEKALDLVKNGLSVNELPSISVNDKNLEIEIAEKKFSKGDNELADKAKWVEGLTDMLYASDGSAGFLVINKILPPEPKSLSEARGLITADYQNYLEKEWIKELRNKYTVNVDYDVLNSLK